MSYLSSKAQRGGNGKRSYSVGEDAIVLASILRGWTATEAREKIRVHMEVVRSEPSYRWRKKLMIDEDEQGLFGDLEAREEEGKLKTEEDYEEVIAEWRKRRRAAGKKG